MSYNSRKHQNKSDIQAMEITSMWADLNKALEENKELWWAFNPSVFAQVIRKAVTSMQNKPRKSSRVCPIQVNHMMVK